jgi:hypothetical protein
LSKPYVAARTEGEGPKTRVVRSPQERSYAVPPCVRHMIEGAQNMN